MIATLIIVLALIGAAVGVTVWRMNATRITWLPVQGVPGLTCVVPAGVLPEVLGVTVRKAADLLALSGPWSRATIDAALMKTSIIVSQTEAWSDSQTGQRVGGSADRGGMVVDRSLASTLHELAHVMEFAQAGIADNEHLTWTARGIWAADNAFQSWLKST